MSVLTDKIKQEIDYLLANEKKQIELIARGIAGFAQNIDAYAKSEDIHYKYHHGAIMDYAKQTIQCYERIESLINQKRLIDSLVEQQERYQQQELEDQNHRANLSHLIGK